MSTRTDTQSEGTKPHGGGQHRLMGRIHVGPHAPPAAATTAVRSSVVYSSETATTAAATPPTIACGCWPATATRPPSPSPKAIIPGGRTNPR